MGLELFGNFSDLDWYKKNIGTIKSMVTELPSFVSQIDSDEFWLKTANSESSWDYDVRIFVRQNSFFIEVSIGSETFYSDVKTLIERISCVTKFSLINDDGETFML
ncbi:hypothetical protein MNBD_GAMMA16-852 [hydrothermal vent metagenome]|uniref:Uncharacterized protein n=1 Tax=hydrothermal vent metagenome TaxID=652676 RepID=A0A3B1A0X3_9ZZZZ